MKRALAERAKQSGHPNGLSPSVVRSSQQPPHKVPKIESKPEEPSSTRSSLPSSVAPVAPISVTSSSQTYRSSGNASLAASPRPSPKSTGRGGSSRGKASMKRQRTTVASSNAEDDESLNSGFFLKHQNSALSSELKQLQYQFRLLEKEREYRRKQCQEVNNALHSLEATWTQMEVALQLGQQPPPTEVRDNGISVPQPTVNLSPVSYPKSRSSGSSLMETPRSTGTGESVELIGALLDSLAALGKDMHPEESNEEDEERRRLYKMDRVAQAITHRALALQRWIWTLLGKITSGVEVTEQPIYNIAELQGRISVLTGQCRDYETRISELAKSRDDAVTSDKKVRRGLYRLASGRMKLPEVLKAVEDDDKDGSSALLAFEENVSPIQPVTVSTGAGGEADEVDGVQAGQLKKQLQDMEEIASCRQEQIEKLTKEREDLSKRVNVLSLPKPETKSEGDDGVSEDDIKRSALYTETWTKMITAERQLEELRAALDEAKSKQATARGDAELARKSLEELLNKHKKRWAELVGCTEENADPEAGAQSSELAGKAVRITELEHKLTQALENVRQADVVRSTLDEATKMNEALQAKLEETKAKNAALMAGKSSARSSSESSSSREKNSSSSGTPSDSKSDKLHREHRRLRKELAAAIASKDSAKAKLERADKERESLVKTNGRLLKQSAEKDDINAKSLSTILHLKELTERLRNEKNLLQQQVKSAGQLNLASRLVSNARERLAEEASKERQALEDKIRSLESLCDILKREKESAIGELSKNKAEMISLNEEAAKSRERCDELVAAATKESEQKQHLMETLAVAQRDAAESARRVAKLKSRETGEGATSEFTTEQLTTQISVLKGRLSCPVCNHRDKNCILLRCRHMFCKQCVEENVRNRSRKCPACGQRFDNKDVEDIWL